MANVLVRHSAQGGLARYAKGKVQAIKHHYLGGKISTISGDVWNVKPVEHKDYSYVTVATVDE